MFAPATPEQRETLLSLFAKHSDGVGLDGIAAAFSPPPDERRVKQWLEALLDDGLVLVDGTGRNARYFPSNAQEVARVLVDLQRTRTSGAAAAPSTATAAVTTANGAVAGELTPPSGGVDGSVTSSPTASTPTSNASAGPVPSDPDFPKMFELALTTLISNGVDRQGALIALRKQAADNGKVGRGIGAYVTYALARLDAFKLADAEIYAITREELERWQARYRAAAVVPTPTPPVDAPPPAPPGDSLPKRFIPLQVPAAVPPGAALPDPVLVGPMTTLETGLTMASVMAVVRKLAGNVVWKTLLPRCSAMIQPKRLMLAWVWGAVLVTLAANYTGYRMYVLVMVPLCGAPWAAFTLREKRRNATLEDLGYAFLLGGIITFFLANFAVKLLRWGASFGW